LSKLGKGNVTCGVCRLQPRASRKRSLRPDASAGHHEIGNHGIEKSRCLAARYQAIHIDGRPGRRREFVPSVKCMQDKRQELRTSRFQPDRGTDNRDTPLTCLLNPLAISGIQASGDQRARRLDPVKITVATELRAPCLLAPRHPAVNIGCGVYARVGGRASRQQCADDYCCKQSAFRFHHGYLPYQNAIGNSGFRFKAGSHSNIHDLPSFRLRSADPVLVHFQSHVQGSADTLRREIVCGLGIFVW
jgi:hypothetical protein